MLTLIENGAPIGNAPDLSTATAAATQRLASLPLHQHSTIAVKAADGAVLASCTNRRIVGTFHKQVWGGPKGDDALYAGEETFDATHAVLLLDHAQLIELEDNSEATDNLGRDHVAWNGPCYVTLTDSICNFFGVDCVEDITSENLASARERINPQPFAAATVNLTLRVQLRVAPEISISEFVENLDFGVTSKTAGVVVTSTELIASE